MSSRCKLQQFSVSLILLLTYFYAVTAPASAERKSTEEANTPVLQGFITAIHLPYTFDMNDCHFVISEHTAIGHIGDKVLSNDGPIRAELRVGAYVQVMQIVGDFDEKTRTATADRVFIRNEQATVRTGKGRILRVVSAGSEPVYSADGYLIRIGSKASESFNLGTHTIADVGLDTILEYKGKIGADGILDAKRVTFTRYGVKAEALSASQSNPIQNSNGGASQTSAPPSDDVLQKRVARIGASLVPAYMRQSSEYEPYRFEVLGLKDDAPAAYAPGNKKFMSGYVVADKRSISVPKPVVERLQDDNQLAAILAEGIAQTLQIRPTVHGAKEIAQATLGSALVGAAIVTDPLTLLMFAVDVGMVADLAPAKKKPVLIIDDPVLAQKDRMALQLMADAGYDPHAAPEAWRIIAFQNAKGDLQAQPYPLRSGYQFNIIATQYQSHTAAVSGAAQ